MIGDVSKASSRSLLPWRNGKGLTEEIFVENDESGSVWRLSLATLSKPAKFSRFDGFHRIFIPVDGPVSLRIDGAQHRVRSRVAAEFEGEDPVHAEPGEGARRALNVMYRRGRIILETEVITLKASTYQTPYDAVALFVLCGSLSLVPEGTLVAGDAAKIVQPPQSDAGILDGSIVIVSARNAGV